MTRLTEPPNKRGFTLRLAKPPNINMRGVSLAMTRLAESSGSPEVRGVTFSVGVD